MKCPVCRSDKLQFFCEIDEKLYHRCQICSARFLDAKHFLSFEEERAHYETHENDVNDAGYRAFLSRLADPLLKKLPEKQCGLDYGCGPGPALATMLREAGHEVALYDPYYVDDKTVLERAYNFITCTEVVEHFHNPAKEFARLDKLLKPRGWLAIMTCFQTDDARFANWRYRKDPTHVVFFKEETFRTLAKHWGWYCEIPAKDIVLLQKSMTTPESNA